MGILGVLIKYTLSRVARIFPLDPSTANTSSPLRTSDAAPRMKRWRVSTDGLFEK